MGSGPHPVHDLRFGGGIIRVGRGDITLVPADAVVNAANSDLVPGGGVDGAIHRAGGPEILADLRRRYGDDRHCDTGKAVVSVAGRLPATWVIHAVGPAWVGGRRGEEELLASAYRASLGHADALGAASITFPAISCGIFGYPLPDGARVALETVRGHLSADHPTSLVRVTFVLFSKETLAAFEIALGRLAAT